MTFEARHGLSSLRCLPPPELCRPESVFTVLKGYPGLNGYQLERINSLISVFARLGSSKPEYAVDFFIEDKLFYKTFLEESCEKLGHSMGSLNSILGTIKSNAKNTNRIAEFITRFDSLRSKMANSRRNRYGDAVILSTIHSSKGLEYKNVYMVDLIDEQFPTSESIQNAKFDKKREKAGTVHSYMAFNVI